MDTASGGRFGWPLTIQTLTRTGKDSVGRFQVESAFPMCGEYVTIQWVVSLAGHHTEYGLLASTTAKTPV